MISLEQLLLGYAEVKYDCPITGVSLDSRTVRPGDLFIALAGSFDHGLLHARQALQNGAVAIAYEWPVESCLLENLPAGVLIGIPDLGMKTGHIAARFYENPAAKMSVIGVTGTNGKTSCSHYLAQSLDDCAIIGTLGWGDVGRLKKLINTTPDAVMLQKTLAELQLNNKRYVAMEVSSHGLEQGRVNGIAFKGVIFTRISRDHLDYHGSMEAYLQAKLGLLDKPGIEFAVINLDDDYRSRITAAIPEGIDNWGYSVSGNCPEKGELVAATDIDPVSDGVCFTASWREQSARLRVTLYGSFNVENVLAVLAVLLALDIDFSSAIRALEQIEPVTGRLERIATAVGRPAVFIDYAHSPDALEKVMTSLKPHCTGALWVVFGCGGDRDKGKRPEMGQIAGQWANHVILTDDNPRNEPSELIIADILEGCRKEITEVIPDRRAAIQSVLGRAETADLVLIAGKGHEDYQEMNGIRRPFSDHSIVNETFSLQS